MVKNIIEKKRFIYLSNKREGGELGVSLPSEHKRAKVFCIVANSPELAR